MAKKVQVNDTFPMFSLIDENDQSVDLRDHLGNPLVVYFYPKDDTPGCTKEACTFRDQFEHFTDAGASVIGISSDSPASHRDFKAKHNLPFSLLSDPGNKIRKQIGVPSSLLGLIPGRVTYIIDPEGKVRHIFNSQLDVVGHVNKALEVIRRM